jgi:type I restriction enzyme S subunit
MEVRDGYAQSAVGLIPGDWACKPLADFLSFISYGFTNPMPTVADGVYMITAADIDHGKLQLASARKTSISSFQKLLTAKSKPRVNDVLLTKDGSLGRLALVGEETICINQSVAVLRANEKVEPNFLKLLLESPWYQTRMLEDAGGSTIKHIYITIVDKMPIGLPLDKAEQRAIATALSDVDALIAGLEKLIAKKRNLKQAAMQQLLTGQTRLPGFSGEWEVKRLGDICEISMGRTPSRLNPAFWGAGHVWLSIADLHGKVLSSSKEQVTPLAASSMRVIPKGTLLMSFKLSIGRLCFAGCDLYTNEAICGFNNLLANPDYLYYALSRTDFSLYGKQAVKGYTLNKKSLALVEVAYPSDKEQQAIANVLSSMDKELLAVESYLSKTRDLKQGMMQELLTGRTRLV